MQQELGDFPGLEILLLGVFLIPTGVLLNSDSLRPFLESQELDFWLASKYVSLNWGKKKHVEFLTK